MSVDLSPGWIVTLSAAVYILPVILMLAGAWLGAGGGDMGSVAGAGAGLVLGVGFNMLLNQFLPFEKLIQIKRC